jgi:hypothetical protein
MTSKEKNLVLDLIKAVKREARYEAMKFDASVQIEKLYGELKLEEPEKDD